MKIAISTASGLRAASVLFDIRISCFPAAALHRRDESPMGADYTVSRTTMFAEPIVG
jgi:hypothetical protein